MRPQLRLLGTREAAALLCCRLHPGTQSWHPIASCVAASATTTAVRVYGSLRAKLLLRHQQLLQLVAEAAYVSQWVEGWISQRLGAQMQAH